MEKISKTFAISGQQPVFAGHFPGHPILPGVLLLAFARDALESAAGRPCRLRAILRQKFLEPVLPGQSIRVECELDPAADGATAKASCRFLNQDGKLVAKGGYLLEWLP